jgi:hypothetical protein
MCPSSASDGCLGCASEAQPLASCQRRQQQHCPCLCWHLVFAPSAKVARLAVLPQRQQTRRHPPDRSPWILVVVGAPACRALASVQRVLTRFNCSWARCTCPSLRTTGQPKRAASACHGSHARCCEKFRKSTALCCTLQFRSCRVLGETKAWRDRWRDSEEGTGREAHVVARHTSIGMTSRPTERGVQQSNTLVLRPCRRLTHC